MLIPNLAPLLSGPMPPQAPLDPTTQAAAIDAATQAGLAVSMAGVPGLSGLAPVLAPHVDPSMLAPQAAPAATPSHVPSDLDSFILKSPEIGADEFGGLLDTSAIDSYQSPFLGLKPYAKEFTDLAAQQSTTKKAETNVVQGGQNGKTVAEQDEEAKTAAVAKAVQDALAKTAHLDSTQFNSMLASLQARLDKRPQAPNLAAAPQGPNGYQLAAAALAALFDHHGATQYLATPFQAAQAEDQRLKSAQLQNYQIQQHAYDQDVAQANDLLRLQSSRDETQARLADSGLSRVQQQYGVDAATQRDLLGDLHQAKTPLQVKAALAEIDAGGFGRLVSPDVRQGLMDEANKAVTDAENEKHKRETYERANKAYAVATSSNAYIDPEVRSQNARLARQLIAGVDPNDPSLAELDGIIKSLAKPSQKTLNDQRKADDEHMLSGKRGAQIDAQAKEIGQRYKIDALRLQTYMPEFREKIAKYQAERRNIENQIASRNLHGQLAVQKAQAKLNGASSSEGALTKSDVNLLKSESSALAKEASVLRAQRSALADRFTGEIRRGSEATAHDLDQRIAGISQRQGEIGATFRINREADQRARAEAQAAAARKMPQPLQGQIGILPVPQSALPPSMQGGGHLPPGWSYGGKR